MDRHIHQAIAHAPSPTVEFDDERERTCATWFEQPRKERFITMTEVFNIFNII